MCVGGYGVRLIFFPPPAARDVRGYARTSLRTFESPIAVLDTLWMIALDGSCTIARGTNAGSE